MAYIWPLYGITVITLWLLYGLTLVLYNVMAYNLDGLTLYRAYIWLNVMCGPYMAYITLTKLGPIYGLTLYRAYITLWLNVIQGLYMA